ncbi:MAG TPA: hypothetical protein VFG35_06630 [Actinoplanes sp.]|nr:hypothetical protein [Actinoplanes sp.]
MSAVLGAPLAVERRAVFGAVRLGMGRRARLPEADAFLVFGVAGGVGADVRPGDLVVAPDPSAPMLAGALRRLGSTVHVGPIRSSDHLVTGAQRRRIAATGALAVDMETASLRAQAGDRPFAAVRVVTDSVGAPLWSPGTVLRGVRGLQNLRTAAPALRQWAAATGKREVLLAAPRSFCAGVLREKFPAPHGPRREDICSATTNRQQAVRAIARSCDRVLVVGSGNSATSLRLVEVAEREGAPAHLVDDAGEVDLAWLAGARTVGITAGASAPPHLVDEVLAGLAGLGPVTVRETSVGEENIRFTLPKEVS